MKSPLAFLTLPVFLLWSSCVGPPSRLMTWPEYAQLRPEWPYVLRLSASRGELLYFGAVHTSDPDHPQLEEIEREWERFQPDIAFTEGGLPPIAATRDEAIRNYGEPGFVRFLASRDDVPTTTLDPSRAEQVAELDRDFSREQVKLFFLLRAVGQYVERRGETGLEMELNRILGIYAASPGLSGPPRSVEELAAAYEEWFPDSGRYSTVPAARFDPVASETFLNDISRTLSAYRDLYIVRLLTNAVADGRRVFAVIGGTHVVMQEQMLRSRVLTLK